MNLQEAKEKYEVGAKVRVTGEEGEEDLLGTVKEVIEDDDGIWVRVDHGEEVVDYAPEDVEVIETKKPKRRRKKKEDKVNEDVKQEMEQENVDVLPWDEDEVVTPEDLDRATRDPNLIPEGTYEFEVASVSFVPPEPGRTGGVRVRFKVITPPVGVEEPEDGWPQPPRLFRRWHPSDLDEKRQSAQRFHKMELHRLIAATGVDVSGGVPLKEACEAMIGRRVLATVVHGKRADGSDWQGIERFQPVEQ